MAVKLYELPQILVRSYLAGVNTFIRGKPAIGKTTMINEFADRMKKRMPEFKIWQFYAPCMSPMDIQASAPNYETHKLDLYNNAALPNEYDDIRLSAETGKEVKTVGMLFLGELPNTDPATAKLLQKYINGEDMSGVLRKPKGVIVVADGNRLEDKSSAQQQGRAFMSRFEQLEVYTDAKDNIAYASKAGWHPYVLTFFESNPALIDNYDEVFETTAAARQRSTEAKRANGSDNMSEEGKLGIWANMRAWERISKKETAAETMEQNLSIAESIGNLGLGVGTAYETHKKMLLSLTSIEDIMANPEAAHIPSDPAEMFSLCMLVALRCTEAQMDTVYKFGQRVPLEFQAVILRHLSQRKGFNVVASAAYGQWMSNTQLINLITGR